MIYKQELRMSGRSILIWSVAIAAMVGLFLGMYPAFQQEKETFMTMIQKFPEPVLKSFGIDLGSIFTDKGFFAYMYSFAQVLLGICGLLFGLHFFGREKIHRASSFLFVKPVTWAGAFLQKFLAGCTAIVLITAVNVLVLYVFGQETSLSKDELAKVLFPGAMYQFFMLSFGGFLAVYLKRIENPAGLAAGIGMGVYLLNVLGRLIEKEFISKISPLYYADSVRLIKDGNTFRDGGILFFAGILLLAIALFGYLKRDKEV